MRKLPAFFLCLQPQAMARSIPTTADGAQRGGYSGFAYYGGRLQFSAADNSNATRTNPDGPLKAFDLVIAPASLK